MPSGKDTACGEKGNRAGGVGSDGGRGGLRAERHSGAVAATFSGGQLRALIEELNAANRDGARLIVA
jgi:hypothetical protein